MDTLIDMEKDGWQALSADPEAARKFYEAVLDGDIVVVLPGGLRIDDRAAALDAMSGQPWSSYDL